MPAKMDRSPEPRCSIARSLQVLGERWTLLIIRDAVAGHTRFADFRDSLGIASDLLTNRLNTLVEAGVMERRPYRELGARVRHSYHLTPAGEELVTVLASLQQWGDVNRPHEDGPPVLRRSRSSGRSIRVAFVDDTGTIVPREDVDLVYADGVIPARSPSGDG
ncbi:winged helix-turn-helix transcriptional regulator [Streptosporangium lutulentum]|uniref:DNA-binding HxlR family transcriptional regulator n=1 Tax=Streptosporangium lutulentum TaxID=1461250 RepID=A0ABT9Q6V9_9ACTN|nr:helix-turn-helix domain-containing protein [Streptosporangium lutulentum]MDP9842106.1 DNA-binding HxlR family transcriptional regulator [Streptosporangium lutulentum]